MPTTPPASSLPRGPSEEDLAFYRAALHELVSIGTELARDIQAASRAEPPAITAAEAAEAFERVARATRRTVLLATRLDQAPAQTPVNPPADPSAARRALIRAVEDQITREERAPTPEAKQALEQEFRERLDAPELAEDLAARPVEDVVKDIFRDMGLGRMPFTDPNAFRRRSPAAIARLHALARGEPVPPPGLPVLAPREPEPDLKELHSFILGTAGARRPTPKPRPPDPGPGGQGRAGG